MFAFKHAFAGTPSMEEKQWTNCEYRERLRGGLPCQKVEGGHQLQ